METNAKVKLRGVQVGRVAAIRRRQRAGRAQAGDRPGQDQLHPGATSRPQIKATTVFGAKYVDLIYPDDPSPQRLAGRPGDLLSRNVTVEANTVFQNLVDVLDQIDPAKLNGTLSALADGVRGQGAADRAGHHRRQPGSAGAQPAQRDRSRADWQRAQGLQRHLQRCGAGHPGHARRARAPPAPPSPTRPTQLDALLLSTIGLSNSGISLLAPNQANLIKAINVLEPTTNLLFKYNPEYTCLLVGAKTLLDTGGYDRPGGNGRTLVLDVGLSLGDDPYHYPDNLPIIGAKGGPGGKPGVRLAAGRRARTGRCATWSPTPGSAPGSTGGPTPASGSRAGPTTSRSPARCPNRPASATCSAGPPSGRSRTRAPRPTVRDLYAPDGTPLWPGLPPAPPPGAPRDPGPDAGLRAVRGSRTRRRCSRPRCRRSAATRGCAVTMTANRHSTER